MTYEKKQDVKGKSSMSEGHSRSKFQSSRERINTAYRKNRFSEDQGYLPKFVRTRSKEGHATYDSVKFIIIPMYYPSDVATYLGNAWTLATQQAYQQGNMKDKVDAQEEAVETIFENALLFFLNMGGQVKLKDLMDNPPESNTALAIGAGTTGTVNVPNFEYLEFNSLINQMVGKIIPTAVVELYKLFNFVIKFTEAYKIGPVEIPEQYYLPYAPVRATTTIQGYIDSLSAVQGQAKRHMDKFGIKYTKFSPEMLDMRIIDPTHPDAIAWFSNVPVCLSGSGKSGYWPQSDGVAVATYYYPGAMYLGSHSDFKYYFISDPNESKINVLAPIFDRYDATNNKYGQLFDTAVGGTLCSTGDTFGVSASQVEATEFLRISSSDGYFILKKFRALYNSAHDLVRVQLNGTNISAVDITDYDLAHDIDLKYGTGLSKNVIEQSLLQYLGDLAVK